MKHHLFLKHHQPMIYGLIYYNFLLMLDQDKAGSSVLMVYILNQRGSDPINQLCLFPAEFTFDLVQLTSLNFCHLHTKQKKYIHLFQIEITGP